MHLSLESRTVKADCPAGQQFYFCQSNSFNGCCSVDACDYPTCPDIASSSSGSVSVSSPTSTLTATVGTQSSTSSTTSSAPTTTTTSMMNAGLVGYTTSVTISTTALATSLPSTPPEQTATSATSTGPSKANITLIVVGVIVGSIAVSIMSILIWFCLRRRKQKSKKVQESIAQYGGKQNEFVLDLPSMRGSFHGSEVFAPFGGQYRSQQSSRAESRAAQSGLPSTRSTTPHVGHLLKSQPQIQTQGQGQGERQRQPSSQTRPPPSPPQTATQTATQSHQAQAVAISSASPDLDINPSTTSLPLLPSDPEKAALSPPPAHLHPIYSLTPTIRPRRQTQPSLSSPHPHVHPGTPLSPSLEPIQSQLSSSLNNLPSFMHNPTVAYEREQRYKAIPRRTSEVRRNTTTSRRHRLLGNSVYGARSLSQGSNTLGANISTTYFPVAELEGSPSHSVNSPVPGRSELEGDMSFLSLVQTPPIIPSRSVRRQTRYTPFPSNQTANIGYESPIIGVGLGVNPGTDTPTSLYSQDSFALPPRQFHPQPQQMTGPRGPALSVSRSMDFLRSPEFGMGREGEAMIVSPLSPDEQFDGGRWNNGNRDEDVMGMGGPSAFAARRRREELTPLSGVSVDVEKEWGSWALR